MAALKRQRIRLSADVRRAIQESDESLSVIARRFGVNPKTVAKWRQRGEVEDRPSGPPAGRHRKLSAEDVEIIVRFRQHTLLPLDDCLYALQSRLPHLTRSTLHRCLQRHSMSRLESGPMPGGHIPRVSGHFDIDVVEVRSASETRHVFKAIEDASKFVFAQMHNAAGPAEAARFLSAVIDHFPGTIGGVRTVDAPGFDPGGSFGRLCAERGIVQEVTGELSLWSDGTRARIERAISDVVTFSSMDDLAQFLTGFVQDYNFRRRLKRLGGRTPFDVIHAAWRLCPQDFQREPHHETMRLEIAPG